MEWSRAAIGLLIAVPLILGTGSPAQRATGKPTSVLQNAELLVQQGRLDEAKAETLAGLQRFPPSVEAYNLLGLIEGRQQDFTAAEESFQKALKIQPGSTKTRNNLGDLYVSEKRLDLAEKEFRTVLRLDPANRDGHYNLALLLVLKGSPANAIVHFQKVHPQDVATRLNLVRAYLQNKQVAQGLHAATALSAENKGNVQVHFSLGVLLASERQYKAAKLELEQADALQPGTFEILYNLGQDLLRDGDAPGAEAALTRAVRIQPDSPETRYLLAQAYNSQARPLDALDQLVRARKLAPQNIDILFLMAQISMSQNYYEDAIPLLESGLRIAPLRPDLISALGQSYFMAGQVDKSIEEFKKLLEVDHSARSYAFLGMSYRNLGRFDEAGQQFKAGLTLDPHNSLCLFNLGFIAERKGDASAAENYFQQALRSTPDFADALLEMANLRIAAKRFPEAKELLQHFVRVSRDPATGYYKLAMVERSLHEAAAADRDLDNFKALSRNPSGGPHPFEHLVDYLDNRSKLAAEARGQVDLDQLTARIKSRPDQPEDLYFLAEVYLKSGKNEEARNTIAQLDKLSASDFRLLTGTGVLLARYRFYESAIAHFQAALKLSPDADEVKFDLANAHFRARHYSDGLDVARQVSLNGQKDEAYLALLGDLYAHLGDTAHASDIYRNAIDRNPDNDQDYLSLALIELRSNDIEGARQTLLKGQQRVPGSGKIFWGLGLVSALQGDSAKAADQLERAVDLLPEWPGGYSTLGVFYYQSGQIDKAREVLNRFKNSNAGGSLDISRIEQSLDRAPQTSTSVDGAMTVTARTQLLQLALSLADRTL